jgi:Outer membrane protein beta-barrel domain
MRARSLALTCAVLACVSPPMAAQESGFGARSGIATGGVSGLDGARSRPGIAIGPTFALPITRWLGVQAELLYTTYGAWLSDAPAIQTSNDVFTQASFRYLQIPLLARLDIGALLHAPVRAILYGGPHASAMLECRLVVAAPLAERVPCGSTSSPFAGMNTFELGAVTGASVAAELFHLFDVGADVRYQRGFDRYGALYGGFRNSVWAFVIRVSGIGGGDDGGYMDMPVPPAIQGVQRTPSGARTVRGVRM